MSPLHAAILTAPVATVELLLNRGANPVAVTADGETPMYLAARSRHLVDEDDEQVVPDLLMRNGAVLDICSAVCLRRYATLDQMLAESSDLLVSGEYARQALRHAVFQRSIHAVQSLLSHGVSPGYREIKDSVLFDVLSYNPANLAILGLLLQHPAVSTGLTATDKKVLLEYVAELRQDNSVAELVESCPTCTT